MSSTSAFTSSESNQSVSQSVDSTTISPANSTSSSSSLFATAHCSPPNRAATVQSSSSRGGTMAQLPVDFSRANLSFSGCGFLCIYHAGVCAALKEYAPQMMRNQMYGASAGAIAAAGLICNVCVSEATSAILQVVCQANASYLQAMDPRFDLMGLVREGLEKILPTDAHKLCTDRLFISLTRYDTLENEIVSKFDSKADLIEAILCSCYIPFFCRWDFPYYKGVCYIDGGFSNNQPVLDANTITISPFSGESDICPLDHHSASILGFTYFNSSIRFTTENLYRFCSCFVPPSQEICSQICRQGFADTLRFLTKNAITPCTSCLIVQTTNRFAFSQLPHSVNESGGISVFPSAAASAATDAAAAAGRRNSSIATAATSSDEAEMESSACFSPTFSRKRSDSECEMCMKKLETRLGPHNTTELFPEIIQQTIDNAKAKNYGVFTYIGSFRMVKWGWSWITPWLLPFEYTIVAAKMLKEWLESGPKRRDLAVDRLHQLADFLLRAIEEKNLLCSHTCQRLHLASSASVQAGRHTTNTQLHRDHSVSQPNTSSDGVSATGERGKPHSNRPPKVQTPRNATHGDSTYEDYEAIGCPADDLMIDAVADEDSMARLIEYTTKRHDAVLAYHYRDAQNKLHLCRIFDLKTPRKSSRETHFSFPYLPSSAVTGANNSYKKAPSAMRANEPQVRSSSICPSETLYEGAEDCFDFEGESGAPRAASSSHHGRGLMSKFKKAIPSKVRQTPIKSPSESNKQSARA